jgi:rhamnogalacturonan endolyase
MQFVVYDLDGDGRAEIACKTADGTWTAPAA